MIGLFLILLVLAALLGGWWTAFFAAIAFVLCVAVELLRAH